MAVASTSGLVLRSRESSPTSRRDMCSHWSNTVARSTGGSGDRVMERRAFFSGAAALLAAPCAAEAQQAGRAPTVGYLSAGFATSASVTAFVSGLRDLGYVEGKTVAIESRYAEERLQRLPELASELVAGKVDVIVVVGGAEAHLSLIHISEPTRLLSISYAVFCL